LVGMIAACTPVATPAPATAVPTAVPEATKPPAPEEVTLVINSWRVEDSGIWEDKIIPVFEKSHPGIKVKYEPSPNQYYVATLQTALQGGTAGDVFACQAFDATLQLYKQGYAAPLNEFEEELSHFSTLAKSAWSTDDGSVTYCMPVASVMHGFTYNKDVFDRLGLQEPATVDEFFAVLDATKKDGQLIPLSHGSADSWSTAVLGWSAVGPAFWKGEEGRWAIIEGKAKLSEEPYVDAWRFQGRWTDYMPDGYQSVSYPDTQQLFMQGKAAVMAAGSWELALFSANPFKMGIFPPPVPNQGEQCQVSDELDFAFGLNPASKNLEAAKALIKWFGSAEFQGLYSNALPGFLPLSDYPIALEDPLAQEYLSWRTQCKTTINFWRQFISRGTPSLQDEAFRVTQAVLNKTLTPEQAGEEAQASLDLWYKPVQP